MNTQKVLQVTKAGDINLIPEYPVEPKNWFKSDGDSFISGKEYDRAVEQAILTAIPVRNKDCAVKYLSVNGFIKSRSFLHVELKPGIYPYNGEVKEGYELYNPVRKVWVEINKYQYDLLSENHEEIRKVAILVEPNAPEKPEGSEHDPNTVKINLMGSPRTVILKSKLPKRPYKKNGAILESAIESPEIEQLRTRNLQLRSEYDDLFKSFIESKVSNKELVEALKAIMSMYKIANQAHYNRNTDFVNKQIELITKYSNL
jgi:hypothetical protein